MAVWKGIMRLTSWGKPWPDLGNRAEGEQLQDLIARLDLLLRSKGQPGLALHPPEDERGTPEPTDPSDPRDPGTISTE